MLYNTTNGQAHNNSTTCCTTNSPPTDRNLQHRNARAQHLDMSRCWEWDVQQVQQVELLSSPVGVVQHVRSWCPSQSV